MTLSHFIEACGASSVDVSKFARHSGVDPQHSSHRSSESEWRTGLSSRRPQPAPRGWWQLALATMGSRMLLLAMATVSKRAQATYISPQFTGTGYGKRYTCAEAKEHDEVIFDCGGEFISKVRVLARPAVATVALSTAGPRRHGRCSRAALRWRSRSPLRATAVPRATATPTAWPTSERRERVTP